MTFITTIKSFDPLVLDKIPLDNHLNAVSYSLNYDLLLFLDSTSQLSASESLSFPPLLPCHHTSALCDYLHSLVSSLSSYASFGLILIVLDCIDSLAHHFQTPLPHHGTLLPHLTTKAKSNTPPKSSPTKEARFQQNFYIRRTDDGWMEFDKAKGDAERKIEGSESLSKDATLDGESMSHTPKIENLLPMDNAAVGTRTDQPEKDDAPNASTEAQWQAYADRNGESDGSKKVRSSLPVQEVSLTPSRSMTKTRRYCYPTSRTPSWTGSCLFITGSSTHLAALRATTAPSSPPSLIASCAQRSIKMSEGSFSRGLRQ